MSKPQKNVGRVNPSGRNPTSNVSAHGAPLRLSDVVTLQRGTTYKGDLLGQPGPVLLGLASIQRNGGFRDDSLKTYGGESPEKLTLRPGDIYVSLKDVTQSADLLGAIARVPPHVHAGRVTQDTVKLTFILEDVPSCYLYWLLRTPSYREYCRAHAIGTTNLSLARQDFLAFPVPRPKDRELTLVETLDALDDKIELNRRMNATLEAMARALFQSWFVDFDPVRAKLDGRKPTGFDATTAALFPTHFQDSPLGHIPQGWTIGKIQDCCTQIQNGGTPRRDEPRYWDGGNIPWLVSGEVRQSIITATESFITEAGLKESSAKWVPTHSTVIALYGATAGQVSFVSSPLTTNQAVCALIPKERFEFFNYLTMLNATTELESKAIGSAQQNISKGIVEETQVILPPSPVVEQFTTLVGPFFDRWIANLHQSRTLATLRDALLPKLLSGELRVDNLEQLAEEVS